MTKKEIADNQGNIFGIFVCLFKKENINSRDIIYAIMPFMILSWYPNFFLNFMAFKLSCQNKLYLISHLFFL